jgi:imidazoleglycerol-phosphate dehydratase/histidinol-phosphatase
MKKALFIDRDGTLILEPQPDLQVDTLEKLEFVPAVFRNLHYIRQHLDYELVMVTNQDGLGTDRYPEEDFNRVQQKMLRAFENEGVIFDDILIDRSLPEDEAETRKPRLGMLEKYLGGDYDLKHSYVIGDRITDVGLAANLGAKAILLGSGVQWKDFEDTGLEEVCCLITENWDQVAEMVSFGMRSVDKVRKTGETEVHVKLNLDGTGRDRISTGIGFFDHLLSQLAKHSGVDLDVEVNGDLHVDEHHTIEDTAITLGEAFQEALGEKRGLARYGFALPMDDCMAHVLIDFGGRSWLVWKAAFSREKIGEMPTEMFMHFFKSFSDGARCNLHITAEGSNEHHKIEAIFKATARTIRMALRRDLLDQTPPSTKGAL